VDGHADLRASVQAQRIPEGARAEAASAQLAFAFVGGDAAKTSGAGANEIEVPATSYVVHVESNCSWSIRLIVR